MSGHGSSLNERISRRPSVWEMRLVPAENGASGASISKIWLNKLKLLPPATGGSVFAFNAATASAQPVRCSPLSSSGQSGLNARDLHATSDNSISKCRIKVCGWKEPPCCGRQLWKQLCQSFNLFPFGRSFIMIFTVVESLLKPTLFCRPVQDV